MEAKKEYKETVENFFTTIYQKDAWKELEVLSGHQMKCKTADFNIDLEFVNELN